LEQKERLGSANFRDLPTGHSASRPFLPDIKVRSRSAPQTELRGPRLWSAMWRAAFRNLAATNLPVPRSIDIGKQEAEAVSEQWKTLVPDDMS
jgi:hypothetical protein